jgi:hypothetical protein
LFSKTENFSFAVLSTAKEKNYPYLCDLCVSSEAGGLFLLTSLQSMAWTILLGGKV